MSITRLKRRSFLINNKISSYKNLKELLLSHNKLTKLHSNQFINLTELNYINLSNNLIRVIGENIFKYNTRLIRINISHNKIKNFKFDLSKLPMLNKLNIEYNNLRHLIEHAFRSYISGNGSGNNVLRIHNNTLECRCNMHWLLKLGDTLNAKIHHDKLCINIIIKNVRLLCFFNTNTNASFPCENIHLMYCDNG